MSKKGRVHVGHRQLKGSGTRKGNSVVIAAAAGTVAVIAVVVGIESFEQMCLCLF